MLAEMTPPALPLLLTWSLHPSSNPHSASLPLCSHAVVWSGILYFSSLLSYCNFDQFNSPTCWGSSTEVLVSSKEEPAVGCE